MGPLHIPLLPTFDLSGYSARGLTSNHPAISLFSQMPAVFNLSAVMALAFKERALYAQATPFPHLVLKNAGEPTAIRACAKAFPRFEDSRWFTYPTADRSQQNKQVMWDITRMPPQVVRVISELNSEPFVQFLETLTGISNLVPDPSLYGGGMHQTRHNGRLDIHVDHDFNPNLQLFRRVSVLLYLSPWRSEYGGNLELWEGYRDEEDHLVRCARSIMPSFNTMVIFTNSETSYHGHPGRVRGPLGLIRKSLAVYYCSAEKHPSYSDTEHHRARFVCRLG